MTNNYDRLLQGLAQVAIDPDVTPENIVYKAALACGVPELAILSGRSDRRTALCRQGIMYFLRQDGMAFSEIGRRLNRDHSTVMHGVERFADVWQASGVELPKQPRPAVVIERRTTFVALTLWSHVQEGTEIPTGYSLRRRTDSQQCRREDLLSALRGLDTFVFYDGPPIVQRSSGTVHVYRPLGHKEQAHVLEMIAKNDSA